MFLTLLMQKALKPDRVLEILNKYLSLTNRSLHFWTKYAFNHCIVEEAKKVCRLGSNALENR